ncbi:cryptochrome/photolyase family protein [Actinomadura scrupuli]|uniref:cryptochrome/photolyase family protein n=1 Tax=Actinomadura scrupuli TaxID=559629 RepID=UPI003D981589
MDTAMMLFTRDLRVRDNPALAAACAAADQVVPLFVLDEAILSGPFGVPNRVHFLLESLDDLRGSLRERGGDLVLRRGDPVAETLRLAAETGAEKVFLSEDVSSYAVRRAERLRRKRLGVSVHAGVNVVSPGLLRPAGGDHYRVFTPYWRAWSTTRRRPLAETPATVRLPGKLPGNLPAGRLPRAGELLRGPLSPDLMPGGERAARERMTAWLNESAGGYDDGHDDLAGDRTSRLSPYLRFGCLSPLELEQAARDHEGFRRQLAWRDFHYQVAAAFPDLMRHDYRHRDVAWHEDEEALAAWCEGRTGYPIVDAGMRQLRREGFMHNRARMIVASFLTRNLQIDWRHGLRHFNDWLLDGDVANNAGNWQWVAGTGNDTRPNRVMNPLRQATRFDPDGGYVRRYVPELARVDAPYIHQPWRLPPALRRELGYPDPIVDPG